MIDDSDNLCQVETIELESFDDDEHPEDTNINRL